MFELIQISEQCYYIQSPAKIGLYKLDDNNVCLVDSGNDKDAGRKVRRILDEHKWKLTAIYNTHSNADHTCRAKRGAKSMLPVLNVLSQNTLFWNRHSYTAVFRARIYDTSFCWHRRALQSC